MLEHGYEPYIMGATRNIPKFYQGFRGYGLNKASFFVELHYANYSVEVMRDFFVFHLNHQQTYGKKMHELHRINNICSKFFVQSLSKKYGAGKLTKHMEAKGWKVWVNMAQKS